MRRGIIGSLATLLAIAAGSLPASLAQAAPAVNGVFNLTATPRYLTQGPDGNIWVTLSGGTNDIAKVTPDGVVTEFDSATYNNPIGITSGPDGNLWLTQTGAVVKVDPADPANPTAFPVASITDARAITTGPDDNLWTGSGDKLVKIPPADPSTFTDTTIAGMGARGISPSGTSLWIADFGSGRIINAGTDGAVIKAYPVGGGPQEVGAAAFARQVAYGNPGTDPQTVGRINPTGDPLTTPSPMNDPFGVTLGADNAWWFAQFAGNNLLRMTQSGAVTTLGGLPAASGPRQITFGPDQTLWVGLETSMQIARVTGVEPPVSAPPQTRIDSGPPDSVKAGKKGAKVSWEFSSKPAMARFDCALKRKGARNDREQKLAKFADCSSPKKYRKLRKGRYVFKVRATAGGATDPSPAKASFEVKAKKR